MFQLCALKGFMENVLIEEIGDTSAAFLGLEEADEVHRQGALMPEKVGFGLLDNGVKPPEGSGRAPESFQNLFELLAWEPLRRQRLGDGALARRPARILQERCCAIRHQIDYLQIRLPHRLALSDDRRPPHRLLLWGH